MTSCDIFLPIFQELGPTRDFQFLQRMSDKKAMRKLFLYSLLVMVSPQLLASEISEWVSKKCQGCSVDAFDEVTFPDGLKGKILEVGRNRVELTFFHRRTERAMREELNVGQDANARASLTESICRQFGNNFRVNRVNYRLVYDTSAVGRAPTPSFETIHVLVCKAGALSFVRPLEPTVNVNEAVPPIHINASGRENLSETPEGVEAPASSASQR